MINFIVISGCQTSANIERTIIQGTAKLFSINTLSMFGSHKGEYYEFANMRLDKNGNFGFVITPGEEGFYTLGSKGYNYDIYVKPN